MQDELLFVEERHDNAEEYLEALAMFESEGRDVVPVGEMARRLHIKPPSAVQMLKRLARKSLVEYLDRKGVRLRPAGRKIGRRMVRNGRLMEVFLTQTLRMRLDVPLAHSFEHNMNDEFADALCTYMGHPGRCPHDYEIPRGACCAARAPDSAPASPSRRAIGQT